MGRFSFLYVLALIAIGAGIWQLWPGRETKAFTVELDNAFGLIEGADVKVAGVRAGTIEAMRIDEESLRALIDIELRESGYTSLREDVFCESRPQSLIGEYFLDCKPGTSPKVLPEGTRITVDRTGSTIPVDLVNNIMRRPYRERFSIILGELGAALAGRGQDLNETIRRASPALRETDRVLRILAEERATIRDLTDDADTVLAALAENREDVGRWVEEARDTSRASAERADGIRDQFRTFPTFLRELTPTMRSLGEAADAQAPALTTMAGQAGRLQAFFDELGPFSEASRPAFRTLAAASRTGEPAVKATRPRAEELEAFGRDLPELATNLAIVLEHLDDRRFATNKDKRSPGGLGYTGLEAILSYVFQQMQATNIYDKDTHLLKVSAFYDRNCANYADAARARIKEFQYCRAILGPSQPGIDQPDPTKTDDGGQQRAAAKAPAKRDRSEERPANGGPAPAAAPQAPASDTPVAPRKPRTLEQALDAVLGPVGPLGGGAPQDSTALLDFLLAP